MWEFHTQSKSFHIISFTQQSKHIWELGFCPRSVARNTTASALAQQAASGPRRPRPALHRRRFASIAEQPRVVVILIGPNSNNKYNRTPYKLVVISHCRLLQLFEKLPLIIIQFQEHLFPLCSFCFWVFSHLAPNPPFSPIYLTEQKKEASFRGFFLLFCYFS